MVVNEQIEHDERTAKRNEQNAARVSRHRKRAREGVRILRITITDAELDEFVRVGVLLPDRWDDDAAIQSAIEQLCRRGHRALVAERERAAAPRPAVMSEANQRLLARLEKT
jgi:hypothetical protein